MDKVLYTLKHVNSGQIVRFNAKTEAYKLMVKGGSWKEVGAVDKAGSKVETEKELEIKAVKKLKKADLLAYAGEREVEVTEEMTKDEIFEAVLEYIEETM